MRKLAIGALSFSAAVFLSCYLVSEKLLPVLAAIFIIAAVLLICLKRKWLKAFIICFFSLAMGFGCFYFKYSSSLKPAFELEGEKLSISAKLLDYPDINENYARLNVQLCSEDLPKLKAQLYYNGYLQLKLQPGDIISFEAKLRPGNERYGEPYRNLTSKNIFLTGNISSYITLISSEFSLKALPVKLNHYISALAEELFPEDTSAFMKSLLIGDKEDFYEDLSLKSSMQIAGLMHIVAISGMHIAFLVGFLKLLLGNTKRSSFICIAIVWFFVFVTGAGPSALRSGLMQTVLLMAPIFRRENDSVTSLSLALALILITNPYAAANVGLQLSFAAMAGLYCFAGPINAFLMGRLHSKMAKKVLSMPIASVASSLAVMVFTLPLTAIHFGYVSLYSVLSNVLIFWAVSLCFCGGGICCILGIFLKVPAILLAAVISWPIRYIIFVAEFISNLPLAAVYMESSYGTVWLILTYILFILAFLSKLKPGLRLILPAALSLTCLLFSFGLTKYSYERPEGVITALDIGQGQCLCLMSGDKTVLYDCGGMGTLSNAGQTAGSYLRSIGRDQVGLLVLSHMQKDHVNGVTQLMELCRIESILIPEYDYSENSYFSEIKAAAEEKGIAVNYLNADSEFKFNNMELRLFPNNDAGEINESSIKLLASFGSYDVFASGDCNAASEKEFLNVHPLRDIELLIAGHHGSKTSSSQELLSSCGAKTVIISSGYNRFGHPAQEVLERYRDYGYNIYRTDQNSSIEIRIGKDYGESVQ